MLLYETAKAEFCGGDTEEKSPRILIVISAHNVGTEYARVLIRKALNLMGRHFKENIMGCLPYPHLIPQ